MSYLNTIAADPSALAPAAPAPLAQMADWTQFSARTATASAACALAGVLLFPQHRVLGFFGGGAFGHALPMLFVPEERTTAICALASTGSAVAGSLLWKEHPVMGYIAGQLAGQAALSFVPGNHRTFGDYYRSIMPESQAAR
jgi:hypothetical protein